MLGFEIATYLAAQGYGTVNTDIFYNFMPPTPDLAISVVQYGGLADEPDLGIDGRVTRLETIRFQTIVRGVRDDSNSSELIAIKVRRTLVAVLSQELSGTRYVSIEALAPPSRLRADDDGRVEWVTNFQVIKIPSSMTIRIGQAAIAKYDLSDTSTISSAALTTQSTSNFVICVTGENGATAPIITDTYNNTWTLVATQASGATPGYVWVFTSLGGVGGANHVFTTTKIASAPTLAVIELLGTSVTLAGNSFTSDGASPFTSPSLSVVNDALLLSVFSPGFQDNSSPVSNPGTNFSVVKEVLTDGAWALSISKRVIATLGDYSASWTIAGADPDYNFGVGLLSFTGMPL